MPNLTSKARAVFANKASAGPTPVDTWNPLTGPIPARGINSATFGVWLGGITNLYVQPAYQFSDDGIDWSGAVYKKAMTTGSSTKTTEEWTWGDQYFTVPGAGETGGAFVRLGVVASTVATKDVEYAEARIYAAWRTVYGSSVACAPTRVWANNPDSFIALTGPMLSEDVAEARAAKIPNLSINASFGLNQRGTTLSEAYKAPLDQQNASLGFSVPIFQWGKANTDYQAAS